MPGLTGAQEAQFRMQMEAHRHDRYETDIELAGGHSLKGFVIHPNVLRPEKMTAVHLARWLFSNSDIYSGKDAVDMGCGSGIQGVVMAMNGARHVTFSDLSHAAVENTKENVSKYGLEGMSAVLEGDLFEKVRGKYGVIVFNHPFFSDAPFDEVKVSSSMLDRGKLIHRFLEDSKRYLEDDGLIVMPYFHPAGSVNDPAVQAPGHGYRVSGMMSMESRSGLQQGKISVYELRLD